ncbi:MAG TPA: hypothetical protein VFW62_05900, partial [bacterium]|nr:hypothetical protein [bacterium]
MKDGFSRHPGACAMTSARRIIPASVATMLIVGALLNTATSQEKKSASSVPPVGQKVFTCGHSFHNFMPPILAELATAGEVSGHEQVGQSSIGGSRVIQHWDVTDDKNKCKELLKVGKVDVLTLSPIHLPDPGIENFARLAYENNPKVRVTVQEFWLPFDVYNVDFPKNNPKT